MTRLLALLTTLLLALPAHALLSVGATAPAFTLEAAKAGKTLTVDSASLLRKGPLVVYFYPAAYTSGCSIEAKMFADRMNDFEKAGATVIGISGDDVEKLQRFSVSHCMSRFAVASDPSLQVAARYEAKGAFGMFGYASRVSYVIAPSGKVLLAHADTGPATHVEQTLAAVQQYQTAK